MTQPAFGDTVTAESDRISPTWLKDFTGSRLRFVCAEIQAALLDGACFAVGARFPDEAPDDAFYWLAADRLVERGFQEARAAYVLRLKQWLDLHRRRGTATGLLLALLGYVSPASLRMRVVKSGGSWDTYEAVVVPFPAGASDPVPPDHVMAIPNNWDWDSQSQPFAGITQNWRTWIIVYTGALWSRAPKCGSGVKCGSGQACGWSGNPLQAESLQALALFWKSAGCWIPYIILSFDNTLFDPSAPPGDASLPDGRWARHGKPIADVTYTRRYVRARAVASSYLPVGA